MLQRCLVELCLHISSCQDLFLARCHSQAVLDSVCLSHMVCYFFAYFSKYCEIVQEAQFWLTKCSLETDTFLSLSNILACAVVCTTKCNWMPLLAIILCFDMFISPKMCPGIMTGDIWHTIQRYKQASVLQRKAQHLERPFGSEGTTAHRRGSKLTNWTQVKIISRLLEKMWLVFRTVF